MTTVFKHLTTVKYKNFIFNVKKHHTGAFTATLIVPSLFSFSANIVKFTKEKAIESMKNQIDEAFKYNSPVNRFCRTVLYEEQHNLKK